MTFHPRPQPFRVGPYSGQVDEALPALANDSDEMFQILFEDLNALDSKVDAGITAATAASSSASAVATVLALSDGEGGGGSEFPSLGLTSAASITIPVPEDGGVVFGGPGGAFAQDTSNFFWDGVRLHIKNDQNGSTGIIAENLGTSGGSTALYRATADTGVLSLFMLSSGFSSGGLTTANWGALIVDSASSGLAVGTVGSDPLVLGTNNTERLRITAGGDVGINRSAPQSFGANYQTLEIGGNTTSTGGVFQSSSSDSSVKARLFVDSSQGFAGTSTAHSFAIQTNGATAMTVLSGGNIGIGITNPATKLVVSNGGNEGMEINPSGGNLVFQIFNRFTSAYAASFWDTTSIRFRTSTTPGDAMIIDTNKFVGIGTTSPKSKLHVEGASGWIIGDEQDTNPTTTELDSLDSVAIYMKANTLVFAYNNGGTITYIKIPMDGSTTTWTHDTTAP